MKSNLLHEPRIRNTPMNVYEKTKHEILKEFRIIPGVGKEIVYFASTKKHDPEKLKWWYWKD